MSYPDFVLMDQKGRYQVIHMMQDFVVEQEQQVRYYMALNSGAKTVFWDFILDEAHAERDANHGAPCMYAGWPSVMEEIAGHLYCNNPAKYWSSLDRYKNHPRQDPDYLKDLERAKNLYNEVRENGHVPITYTTDEDNKLNIDLDSPAKCDPAQGAVICNPLVFGKVDGKPFCVAAKSDRDGYNASFLCERAVNKIKNQENQQPYEKLMDGIIADSMKPENRPLFLSSLRHMYDMCMCSQDKDDEGNYRNGMVAKVYADRMFYTRTCAGILHQSQTILGHISLNQEASCPVFTEASNDKDWLKFAREAKENIKLEIENLGRDKFVRYLEISKTDARQAEQEEITARRNQAKDARNGVFCPIDIEEPEAQEDDAPSVAAAPCSLEIAKIEDKEKITVAFTPGSGRKLEEYEFSKELDFEDGKVTLDAPDQTTIYTAKAEKGDSCEVKYTVEDSSANEVKCSLALKQEAADDGVKIIAQMKVDGEEVGKEEGYTVEFVNTALEAEEDEKSNTDLAVDTDGMIGDPSTGGEEDDKQENEDQKAEGRELASLDEEEDSYAVLVKALDKEQKIYAYMNGDGCSEEANVTVAAKKKAKKEKKSSGGPMRVQPNLIQKRQRGGFILRGTR